MLIRTMHCRAESARHVWTTVARGRLCDSEARTSMAGQRFVAQSAPARERKHRPRPASWGRKPPGSLARCGVFHTVTRRERPGGRQESWYALL